MGNFFTELKRRHIYRVAAAYAVVAWLLLQLFNNLTPIMKLPDWAGTLVLVLLIGGFPIALFFAWMRELPPADPAVSHSASVSDWALVGILLLVLGATTYQEFAASHATATVQPGVEAAAAKPAGISVAVLPFANMSGDAGQDFFSDGMTEEINAALAKVPDLHVVARTSAFQFKGQSRDIEAIGQQLHASHLIEGSVRKAGTQVRITAQLVEADNGLQLWSESYDRELTNIFAIQEDIAQSIASALKVPLGFQQGGTLVRNRTNDLESYQQYLHARALVRARAVNEAINILEPVVANDPTYAPAWALLATAYTLVPTFPPTVLSGSIEDERRFSETFLDKADNAARKALQLDSRHAAGYGALADSQYRRLRQRWSDAEDLFRQALTLDANDPEVLHAYRQFLVHIGRLKDALNVGEQLRTLEPFVPTYNIVTAAYMQINGQNDDSIPILEATPADAAAGGYNRNVYLARAYAAAGRFAEAADTLLLITGNRVSRRSVQDAVRILRMTPGQASKPESLPTLELSLNFVYAYAGAAHRVMDSPEHELAMHYANTSGRDIWLPLYASLRKTDRFKAYIRNVGLVDYWKARGWPDLCHPTTGDDFECS